MGLHEKLKHYRALAGKTQQETANYLGIDKSTYAHYESGRRRPNDKDLMKIARFLRVPIFPVRRRVKYPEGLLDRLEDCLNKIEKPTNDFHENRQRIDEISDILNEVLDIRSDTMSIDGLPIDELNLDFLPTPFTVLNVELDERGEDLIKKAIQCKKDIIK